jgi:hypothetical protein
MIWLLQPLGVDNWATPTTRSGTLGYSSFRNRLLLRLSNRSCLIWNVIDADKVVAGSVMRRLSGVGFQEEGKLKMS